MLQAPPDRLHLVLQRSAEDVFEPDYVADVPLVPFCAFTTDFRVSGWVRLTADRLTDLLNAHGELLITDVDIEVLATGATRSLDAIEVRSRDLVAVRASGPRGDEARWRRTRTHAVAARAGDYLIGGYLHAEPGTDPVASLDGRPPMIPLTDAWIETWSGEVRSNRSCGTIIVNRGRLDWIRVVSEDELLDEALRPSLVERRIAS